MLKTKGILILALLIILIGCAKAGGEGETADPILPPDACSLLSGADIAEAIGTAEPLSGAGEMDEERGVSSCEWLFPEDTPGTMSLVVWTRNENDGRQQLR